MSLDHAANFNLMKTAMPCLLIFTYGFLIANRCNHDEAAQSNLPSR